MGTSIGTEIREGDERKREMKAREREAEQGHVSRSDDDEGGNERGDT